MSYSEQDGQVVLTMSREDFDLISDYLKTLATFRPGMWGRLRELLDRLNQGNPNYAPYQGGEK